MSIPSTGRHLRPLFLDLGPSPGLGVCGCFPSKDPFSCIRVRSEFDLAKGGRPWYPRPCLVGVESAPSSSKSSSPPSSLELIIKNRFAATGISLAPSSGGNVFLLGRGVAKVEAETLLARRESIRDRKKEVGRDVDKEESLAAPWSSSSRSTSISCSARSYSRP